LDGNRRLRNRPEGFAVVRNRCDERGNVSESSWFKEDGSPARGPDGAPMVQVEHDSRGNQIAAQFFDGDRRPLVVDGCGAKVRERFNVYGQPVEVSFFGIDEKPILVRRDCASSCTGSRNMAGWLRVMDCPGCLEWTVFFDMVQNPIGGRANGSDFDVDP